MKIKKINKKIILLVIACLAGIGLGIYFYLQNPNYTADTASVSNGPGLTVIAKDKVNTALTKGQVVVISANMDNMSARKAIFYKLQEGYKCVHPVGTVTEQTVANGDTAETIQVTTPVFNYAQSMFYASFTDPYCATGTVFKDGAYFNPFTTDGQRNINAYFSATGSLNGLALISQKDIGAEGNDPGAVFFGESELGAANGMRPIAVYIQENTSGGNVVSFKMLVDDDKDWHTTTIASNQNALDMNNQRSTDDIFWYTLGERQYTTITVPVANQSVGLKLKVVNESNSPVINATCTAKVYIKGKWRRQRSGTWDAVNGVYTGYTDVRDGPGYFWNTNEKLSISGYPTTIMLTGAKTDALGECSYSTQTITDLVEAYYKKTIWHAKTNDDHTYYYRYKDDDRLAYDEVYFSYRVTGPSGSVFETSGSKTLTASGSDGDARYVASVEKIDASPVDLSAGGAIRAVTLAGEGTGPTTALAQVATLNDQNQPATQFSPGDTVTATIALLPPSSDYSISVSRTTAAKSAIHFDNINYSLANYNFYDNAENSSTAGTLTSPVNETIQVSASDPDSNRVFGIRYKIPTDISLGTHTIYGEILGTDFTAITSRITPVTITIVSGTNANGNTNIGINQNINGYQSPQGVNLAYRNPNFSDHKEGTGSVLNQILYWTDWIDPASGGKSETIVNPAICHSAIGNCLRMTKTGYGYHMILQGIGKLQKGKTYRLSVWAKSASGTALGHINLYDSENRIYSETMVYIGTEWTKITKELTVSEENNYYDIFLYNATYFDYTIYYDDVWLEQID
ncbi:MAG: carbohydrate binding domain-containing protein [Patescibacteria group bacterium]